MDTVSCIQMDGGGEHAATRTVGSNRLGNKSFTDHSMRRVEMNDAMRAPAQVLVAATAPAVPARILVVDDETAIREELMDWLGLRGIACHAAANAAEAKQVLAAEPGITVLLTDLNMPGMNGIALALDALASRSEEHALEVVVLTAHATADHAIEALRARAIDFVAKPPQLALLTAALDRAHAGAARRRQAYRDTADLLAKLADSVRALRDLAEAGSATPPARDDAATGQAGSLVSLMHHEILAALYKVLGQSTLIRRTADAQHSAELQEYAQSMVAAAIKLSERIRALLKATGALPQTGHADTGAQPGAGG